MTQEISERATVEITWPRTEGEVALWGDLLLARALRAAVGKSLHPVHGLGGTHSRLVFAKWTAASAARAEHDHVMAVTCADSAEWDLDLVGANPGNKLCWSKGFVGFLAGIEKDRAQALKALSDRPMLRVATRLGAQLGLTKPEVEALCVMALLHSDEVLQEPLSPFGVRGNINVGVVLECLMKTTRRDVMALLGPESSLRKLRLVRHSQLKFGDLNSPPIAPILAALINAESAGHDPLAYFLVPAVPSKLALADYSHLPVGIDLLVSVLRETQESRRPGVNLLLHGAPGTGKTQLSRLLAQQADATAFEVPLVDADGESRNGGSRLESLQLCQQALSLHAKPLMIFDEAEDLFPSPEFAWFFQSAHGLQKGWINRILETNPVPTIWIANQVGHLDPAFLRRFDLVVEVPPPPRAVRQRMLDTLIGPGLISATWRAELAELENLGPDEIERLARTSAHLQGRDSAQRERVLRQVFEQARRVTGRKSAPDRQPLPGHYRADLINADADLREVADSLVATGSGRLCLYGPPGSGKSAFAQHLSERIGLPLTVRRASDLIDKYIGETEKNLARAFGKATDEGALLLIDEADSFLQDRQRAQHSWEISHVNELLTQMERFEGVLVMCTNLFDQLDAAALRRFDIKVKLDYLRADQRLAMFEECADRYAFTGSGLQQQLAHDRLARLDRLTPGDFQTVLRRRRLVANDSVISFVEALAAEQAGKRGDASRSIGFVRSE
jgi:SpoVK/Ycf46/Vps4 family AAA+-type ATPase